MPTFDFPPFPECTSSTLKDKLQIEIWKIRDHALNHMVTKYEDKKQSILPNSENVSLMHQQYSQLCQKCQLEQTMKLALNHHLVSVKLKIMREICFVYRLQRTFDDDCSNVG